MKPSPNFDPNSSGRPKSLAIELPGGRFGLFKVRLRPFVFIGVRYMSTENFGIVEVEKLATLRPGDHTVTILLAEGGTCSDSYC